MQVWCFFQRCLGICRAWVSMCRGSLMYGALQSKKKSGMYKIAADFLAALAFKNGLPGQFLNVFFFFSSRRRHTRFSSDWSSDVCSSDLNSLMSADQHYVIDPPPRPALAVAG